MARTQDGLSVNRYLHLLGVPWPQPLDAMVADYERSLILLALRAAEGDEAQAARTLRIRLSALRARMRRLDILGVGWRYLNVEAARADGRLVV